MIDLDITFFVQIVLFFVVFFTLRALVFKPVLALFDAREKGIHGAREEAEQLEQDAAKQAAAFEEEMKKVKALAGDERDRLRAEGLRLEQTLLAKVRTETTELLDRRRAELREEKVRARQRLDTEVPALGRQIATTVLGREVVG
ncbi:MAG: ATP synthase F0 subunit B [Deltaproteobacteria bacterium]|nr:ATP synthase F0 subunit B [Deltaproteobacteria bacterium]